MVLRYGKLVSKCAKNDPLADLEVLLRMFCVAVCPQELSCSIIHCSILHLLFSSLYLLNTFFLLWLWPHMNNPKGTQLASSSRWRYAQIPNTSGFWTDLYLARCACRSSSVILDLPVIVSAKLMEIPSLRSVLHAAMQWNGGA